jgi:hypothetical protein
MDSIVCPGRNFCWHCSHWHGSQWHLFTTDRWHTPVRSPINHWWTAAASACTAMTPKNGDDVFLFFSADRSATKRSGERGGNVLPPRLRPGLHRTTWHHIWQRTPHAGLAVPATFRAYLDFTFHRIRGVVFISAARAESQCDTTLGVIGLKSVSSGGRHEIACCQTLDRHCGS